ncbi:MAG: hypothetical protein IKZ88_10215 [Neisseriaceae bacterium]|nr:hypothetical protein [Neisseriaceae bacterium]
MTRLKFRLPERQKNNAYRRCWWVETAFGVSQNPPYGSSRLVRSPKSGDCVRIAFGNTRNDEFPAREVLSGCLKGV